MAHNDTEIEIKIPVDEESFLNAKKIAGKIAKFSKNSHQSDEYFTPGHRNFVEPKFPFEWLSIRKRGKKSVLNYKHFYPENAEVTTHCDEFETEIEKQEQTEKMFSALDMRKLVIVEKERDVFIYEDEFEIAFDFVEDLGYFIEIETMKDFGSVGVARGKLFDFAKRLGIDPGNAENRGYPYMLMKKRGLIK